MIGAILAGGRASRLGGGDKGLKSVGGRSILAWVAATLHDQCDQVILNANGDPARFADYGFPVVSDSVPAFAGPLAGILASLDWSAAHHPARPFLVVTPVDTPFLPSDLVARLAEKRDAFDAAIACASSHGRRHPAVSVWSVALREDLRQALEDGVRKVGQFLAAHATVVVDWPAVSYDPFFNVNTMADLELAQAIARDVSIERG